jgi:hypothetical protein
LRPHGVDVLGLSPGLTTTPMIGRLEQSFNFGRIGMIQLRPEFVARQGLKQLGRRPSMVVGSQYKFFSMLTKRILSRAAGAWVFGTLIRIALNDQSKLDPAMEPRPTGPTALGPLRRNAPSRKDLKLVTPSDSQN